MMDLDEAIRHCEEVAEEKEEDAIIYHNCAKYKQNLYEKGLAKNTEKECYACAEEHHQLAEWLKELKAYREGTGMKLLIDIPEHIYEHAKETTEDSRDEFDAMRAIANGTQQESRSEIPNTCGDAISRKHLLEEIALLKKVLWFNENTYGSKVIRKEAVEIVEDVCIKREPSVTPQPCGDAISREEAVNAIYDLCGENVSLKENPWRDNPHMDAVVDALENLPSVTPQQRTGRWIEVIDETDSLGNKTWHHECSICGSDKSGWGTYKHCPDCGAKMEVEE